jgi:hypothetical protein
LRTGAPPGGTALIVATAMHGAVKQAAALARARRYEDALLAYESVLAKNGNDLGVLNECGGLHRTLGRPQAALGYFDRALKLAPFTVELLINKGTALVALNRFAEALDCFSAAAAVEPGRAEAQYNASLVRLRLGDFAAGWRGYEWRWRKADWAASRRNFSAPVWLGREPIKGKTILLHAEQGLGDTMQFIRYAPLVAGRGARVILECQAELTGLLGNVEGVAQVVARGETLPDFDMHCPLLSLPLAFGTLVETIPNVVPYIAPPLPYLHKWVQRIAGVASPRIGLVWAGNPTHYNDRNRSIALAALEPILGIDGLHFVSLQKSATAADVTRLRQFENVTPIGDELADFADTAAVIAMLDVIVTVDTATAHLAGAIGKVAALLLPFSADFRWLVERGDSPLYPTARLFRQTALGDWNEPVERLRRELKGVARRPQRQRAAAIASG